MAKLAWAIGALILYGVAYLTFIAAIVWVVATVVSKVFS